MALSFCLAGCTASFDDLIDTPEAVVDDQIKIVACVEAPLTRAGADNSTLNSFGLIITNPINDAYNYNCQMKLGASGWNPTDGTSMMWDTQRSPVVVVGFSPYVAGISATSVMPFSVAANQSSADAVLASDLLITKQKVDPQQDLDADGAMQLTFSHAMSKLKVRVTCGGSTDANMTLLGNMVLNGTIASGYCDLAADAPMVSVDSNVASSTISLYKGDTTHECILVPQQVASGFSVNFSYNGKLYIWNAPSAITLQPGVEYELAINIGSGVSASMYGVSRANGAVVMNLN